jgi:purine-binding chemotaxis protein CheW
MSTEIQITGDSLLVVSFILGDSVFGIDAQQVQEVTKVGDITPVHHAPAEVVGIRSLRGRIVTVIDLRASLHLGAVTPSPANRVLIVDWQGEPVGLLVDSIGDTFTTRLEDLAPPPANLDGVQSRNLRGVGQGCGRLVALLDHETLLRTDALSARASAPEQVVT